ncbi:MAG: DNA-binding protein [Bacteroidaceae bacterium]|nr:DNA-binding protein [Bacteroidaceae bacterium]
MAIKIKAVERKLKFDKNGEGEYRYVMQPELYSALDQEKVIREAALRSGVSQGVMQACWDAAGEVIKAWATEGHSVALPGLGTMRFGLSAQSVADVSKVKSELIKTRRIIFTPNTALKQELAQTAVMITCYDRNGDIVRRVTTTSGEVVTEDDTDTTQGSGTGADSSNTDTDTGAGNGGTGAGSETGGNGGLG